MHILILDFSGEERGGFVKENGRKKKMREKRSGGGVSLASCCCRRQLAGGLWFKWLRGLDERNYLIRGIELECCGFVVGLGG